MFYKLLYFVIIISCIFVSLNCDDGSDETSDEVDPNSFEKIVEIKCTNITGDSQYYQKVLEAEENSTECVQNAFEISWNNARDSGYESTLFERICEKRENYYNCFSIVLDEYISCLTSEENVALIKIRKVFRRIIAQLCLVDQEQIIEFLNGNDLDCYQESIVHIKETLTSLLKIENNNTYLPLTYINNETCVTLTALDEQIKPILLLCKDTRLWTFFNNLIRAIEDELSCNLI